MIMSPDNLLSCCAVCLFATSNSVLFIGRTTTLCPLDSFIGNVTAGSVLYVLLTTGTDSAIITICYLRHLCRSTIKTVNSTIIATINTVFARYAIFKFPILCHIRRNSCAIFLNGQQMMPHTRFQHLLLLVVFLLFFDVCARFTLCAAFLICFLSDILSPFYLIVLSVIPEYGF